MCKLNSSSLLLLFFSNFIFAIQNNAALALNSGKNGVHKYSKVPSFRYSSEKTPPSMLSLNSVASVSLSGGAAEVDDGKQSIPSSAFNLVKACLGAGILSLPAGVAAMGDVSAALIPASLLLVFLGLLSAYSFYSIGRTCSEEKANSLGEAWEKIIGQDSAWMVTLSCFITPLGAALAYSIVLGDFFSTLAKAAGVKGVLALRQTSILAITLAVLYPLCSLKSLSALAPVSIIGVISVLLTAVFMIVRVLDGTYAAGGAFVATLNESLRPSFGAKGVNFLSPSTLVLTSMAATAYLCHFNAPDFYQNLKSNTMPRFKALTILGFGATGIVSILMMCMGFLTFGAGSTGMILNNYSAMDHGATICRLLMCVSLIGSYPFVFGAMKSNFIAMTQQKGKEVSEKVNKNITRLLLGATTLIALALDNVGFVVSFNGALMGSAIIYIFPSLLFLKSRKTRVAKGLSDPSSSLEKNFNRLLVVFGVICAIIGGGVSIADAFFPHLLK